MGIRTGELEPDSGMDTNLSPTEDTWEGKPVALSVTAAAELKGVTRGAIHAAIQRGDIIARKDPGVDRLLVSPRSLQRWHPMKVRQEAGRRRQEKATS